MDSVTVKISKPVIKKKGAQNKLTLCSTIPVNYSGCSEKVRHPIYFVIFPGYQKKMLDQRSNHDNKNTDSSTLKLLEKSLFMFLGRPI